MRQIVFYLCFFITCIAKAAGANVDLEHIDLNLSDYASLQRGAKTYMNYCIGCHNLKFARYDGLSKGIGILDDDGNVLKDVVKSSLMFNAEKLSDSILTSMDANDAAIWFGVSPPDLSLVTRSKGSDWVYSFLKSFYLDESRPWGVNNTVFPATAMPHVLFNLQGVQELVLNENNHKPLLKLNEEKQGSLSKEEYDSLVYDLVNFLSYVGEPSRLEREHLGVFVLLFLGIMIIFSYLLKREYWKNVH